MTRNATAILKKKRVTGEIGRQSTRVVNSSYILTHPHSPQYASKYNWEYSIR